MKFEQYAIHPALKKNLANLGFKKPTDIQFRAIPSVLKGEDVLAIAQTGTGKTAAFAVPILHQLLQTRPEKNQRGLPRALVLVPTRELAVQTGNLLRQLLLDTPLRFVMLYGGVDEEIQTKRLQEGVDLVIATPGRLFDLQHRRLLQLNYVRYLILDEADQMLALGFYKDIQDVIQRIPDEHQTLFFSATITPEIKRLAYKLVHNPIRIQISPKDPVSKNVRHWVAFVAMDDKRFFLERILRENEKARVMVFVRTKVRADRVQKALERAGISSSCMHGNVTQEDRFNNLAEFRKGDQRILISTDLSARGIDIPGVSLVVNYDLPEIAENYVHRVGRTGRGMEKGRAVSLCAEEEKALLEAIESYTGYEIPEITMSGQEYAMTLASTEEKVGNWQQLLNEAEKENQKRKGKPFKKK